MALSPVQNLQLHNQIERVLHAPGNYQGGILEMAIVIDCAYSVDAVRILCRDIVTSCKNKSEVFRNVRLNMIRWKGEQITSGTTAMAYLQTGTYFEDYEEEAEGSGHKSPQKLCDYLKRFQARSKLILLLTPDEDAFAPAGDKQLLIESMNPFLKQKLIVLFPDKIIGGNDIFRKLLLSAEETLSK